MDEMILDVMGKEIHVKQGVTFAQLAESFQNNFHSPIMVAKQGNHLRELTATVKDNGPVLFYDLTDTDAMRVYARGVSFLMVKAVKELLGSGVSVVIEYSIHKSYYCEINQPDFVVDSAFLNQLKAGMNALVAKDIPIVKRAFSRDEAIRIVKSFGMEDKARLFRYRRASNVNLYELDGLYDYFYGYMPASTGCLKKFELTPYENGFLIHFPDPENPERILPFQSLEKVSSVFMEHMKWCSLMGVNNVADLNDVIADGGFGDLVRVNEALHEKKVAEIADAIHSKIDKVKVVLIAGPSSSGKTTFANRLCVQLKVLGIVPHTISLDDYFINRDQIPFDEFGRQDFERVDRLDLELLNSDLNRLINGEAVELPYYNFVTGKREYNGNIAQLEQGGIFVIEGIHGLNDKLTESILPEHKFKIFICPMTQLHVDDHNHVPTVDCRLIRRIVRDHQFRGRDAAGTIDGWASVVRGEQQYIFPFQENADMIFNSAMLYELAVLKSYIEPLLFSIDEDKPQYADAKRLIKFMGYFLCANADAIPNNSIIKEFIGGSCFRV